MTHTSFRPVRELINAICVEPIPGKPPDSLEIISSANWCANLRTCASVGAPRYTLPTTASLEGLRTSYIHAEMATSLADSTRLPNATKLELSGGSVHVCFCNSLGAEGTCAG